MPLEACMILYVSFTLVSTTQNGLALVTTAATAGSLCRTRPTYSAKPKCSNIRKVEWGCFLWLEYGQNCY